MKLLTANRLADGAVVWLAPGPRWSVRLDDAAVLDAEEAATALEAALAQPGLLVGPYLIDTDAAGEVVARERLRERIRGGGPTVGHSLAAPKAA
jgi:hypothetical protein